MQPGIKNDLVYLLLILESACKIELYSSGFSNAPDFYQSSDQLNFNACLLLLSNIGEQSAKVSNELKAKYPDVSWNKIKAVRNRITHDYTGVDSDKAFSIIRNELPELKSKLQLIIRKELAANNFNKDDFEVARSSSFYRHIDFSSL